MFVQVDSDVVAENSHSADEETADAGGSDHSAEEAPSGADDAAGEGL